MSCDVAESDNLDEVDAVHATNPPPVPFVELFPPEDDAVVIVDEL